MDDNLWPSFGEIRDLKTPKSILNEQAKHLEEATYNLLKAEISSSVVKKAERNVLSHKFKIIAPFLANYSFILLRLEQDIVFMYPNTVVSIPTGTSFNIEDETSLNICLKEIFNNQEIIQVIQRLLEQSKAAKKEDELF